MNETQMNESQPKYKNCAVGASVLALALLVPASSGAAAPRGEVHGEVSVREVELSVALPDDTSALKVRSLDATSFVAVRDGRDQAVARAERIDPKDRSWSSVVWVDRVLASPDNILRSTQSLAERAGDLTRLGNVEIVVADPRAGTAVADGTNATALRAMLETIGASTGATSQAESAVSWHVPDAVVLRRQCDRILVWIAAQRVVGPRVLWLTMDGMGLSLGAVTALGGRSLPGVALRPGEAEAVATLTDLGRALAAYGWTTVVMTSQAGDDRGGSPSPESSYDRWHGNLENTPGSAATLFHWPASRNRSRFDPRTLAAELDPAFAAPRLVAEETGGWMLTGPWDLPVAFEELNHRWRVWLRADDVPDGTLRPVSISLKKGGELRSARWLRSSAPEAIAEARLRLALAPQPGSEVVGDLALRLESPRIEDGVLNVAWAPQSGLPAESLPSQESVRVRAAVRAADGSIGFPAVTSSANTKGWQLRLAVPAGATAIAVTLDDLRSESFAIEVLPMPALSPVP